MAARRITFGLCSVLSILATASTGLSTRATMIRGVGSLRTMRGRDAGAAEELAKLARQHVVRMSSLPSGAPVRATLVTEGTSVVLVEEWETPVEREAYVEGRASHVLDTGCAALVSEPPTCEDFPECLHIRKPTPEETVGVLVRQRAASVERGKMLRDAQRQAYERQMVMEPGCTCCIILAGSAEDASQVRIVELWRTMEDVHFHESSEWHARGEEKVVPLVVDMDCDFVKGFQLLS